MDFSFFDNYYCYFLNFTTWIPQLTYLLSIGSEPDTVLGPEDNAMNGIEEVLTLSKLTF